MTSYNGGAIRELIWMLKHRPFVSHIPNFVNLSPLAHYFKRLCKEHVMWNIILYKMDPPLT